MPAVDDLLQERRRNGVDEVRAEDTGGLKVDRIRVTRLEIVERRAPVVEVHPEFRRVDASILNLRQRQLVRVDVVDRKQARNPLTARGRRNETRHPVVAVDEVWLHVRNDVIDDLALE